MSRFAQQTGVAHARAAHAWGRSGTALRFHVTHMVQMPAAAGWLMFVFVRFG